MERQSARLSIIECLEQEAQRRFVRWDPALWQEILAGPLVSLTEGFKGATSPTTAKLLEAYLRLCANGIGLGYLFPERAGGRNFFTLAFTDLLPRHLPSLAPARQAQALAQCWNLAENLEQSPPWLRQIFLRLCARLRNLEDLETLVLDISGQVLQPPTRTLKDTFAAQWVHLGDDDQRFLPGRVEFVAPTVVRVYDRHRDGRDGSPPATLGVWLTQTPITLGPMGADAPPGPPEDEDERLWAELTHQDHRFTPAFDTSRNEWRACATLMTSQMMVVLTPA